MKNTTMTDRLPIGTDTIADTVVDTAQRLVDLVPDGVGGTVTDVVTDGVTEGRRFARSLTGRDNRSSRTWLIAGGLLALATVVAIVAWRKRTTDRHLTGVDADDWKLNDSDPNRSVA